MQHMTIVPVKGKTTTTPTSTPAGSLAYPITLEEFYTDTTTKYWYKKYSDGWIEQGGYVDLQSIAAYGSVAVTFPTGRVFVSVPIYLECQPCNTSTGGGDGGIYGVRDISNAGFTFTRGTGTNYSHLGFYWTAKGI